MEISPCHNSVAGHQIATNFCTCHDSTAVVPCAKFCSDHCIRIEMRANRNSHRIRIAMEKPLVKRAPDPVYWRIYEVLGEAELTQWGPYKIHASLQITFSNQFLSEKIVVFWFKFYSNLFPRVQLNCFGSDNGLAMNQWKPIIWTNYELWWYRYASYRLQEVRDFKLTKDTLLWIFLLKQGKSEGFESCDQPIVRKRPIWVKIGDVLSCVTLKFDGWPWKTIGHLSFAVSSFV